MKKMLFILVWGFSVLSFADDGPGACPDVSQIKSQPLTAYMYYDPVKAYSVFTQATYDSSYMWGFGIAPIDESNGEAAMKVANDLLPLVTGNPSPHYYSQANAWICEYELPGNYRAMAATQMDPAILPMLMK